MMMMGGSLDGPIKYPPHGKVCACVRERASVHSAKEWNRLVPDASVVPNFQVAAVRSPDGHMIGLYEPA